MHDFFYFNCLLFSTLAVEELLTACSEFASASWRSSLWLKKKTGSQKMLACDFAKAPFAGEVFFEFNFC
ncbi:MAG: hypothetical protein ACD_67C00090G0001 [uncultured bacterium]|nr:MAG: hypothetical protein ACD_67C00090G0001 [uncultured bacterium]